MNQPFSPLDLHPDGSLLTGLLRMFFWALVIIDNDNHRQYHFAKWLPQMELGECTPIKLKEVITNEQEKRG
jgi:hypothetical protein